MAVVKTITIPLALMAALCAAPSAHALSVPSGADPVASTHDAKPLTHRLAQRKCPGCGKYMVRVWKQIRPGVWAWVWFCPEPTCN